LYLALGCRRGIVLRFELCAHLTVTTFKGKRSAKAVIIGASKIGWFGGVKRGVNWGEKG